MSFDGAPPGPSSQPTLVLPSATAPRTRPPPAFAQPQRITSFSYDEQRGLHFDDRARKYFHHPPMGADLNRGFEKLISRDETKNEHLDSLLFALMDLAERDPSADVHRSRASLITWRGLATRLSTAAYESRNGFNLNIMLIDGTLYIEEHLSPAAQRAKRAEEEADPRRKLWGYYGYSFESYCTTSKRDFGPGDDPWDGNVNTNVQWCNVVKTRLGASERIIIGGEVDCVSPTSTSSMIELKTSMQLNSPTSIINFERKLCKFYMQSFLLGVDEVKIGFRDARGYLRDWHDFKTLEMPRCVRGKEWEWDPHRCLATFEEVLAWIRQQISEMQGGGAPSASLLPPPVYRLTFTPAPPPPRAVGSMATAPGSANTSGGTFTLTTLGEEDIAEVQNGQTDRVGFLPPQWWQFLNERREGDARPW